MEGAKALLSAPRAEPVVMNRPPDRIETERLILREPSIDDASAIFEEYASDPLVTQYLAFKPHHEVETVRKFLRERRAAAERGERFAWAVTIRGSDRPIGMAEIRLDGTRADFGYVLAKRYWGRGYMVEALRPVMNWALGQDSIHRVWAFCDVENRGSARVLEKLGMQREGVLRKWFVHPNLGDEPRDCYSYSKVKE